MIHYILEVWLWMLGLFLLGCLIGALAWRRFGRAPVAPERAGAPRPGPPHGGEEEEAA